MHRLQSAELQRCFYKHLSRLTHLPYAATSTGETKLNIEEEDRYHAHVQRWLIVSPG